MAYAQQATKGFTVTFRTLVLSAFTRARPQPAIRVLQHAPRSCPDVVLTGLADRVRAAFTDLPPNETEVRVIAALMRHPGSTSAALSEVCGWSRPFWHTHFGLMCQRRADYLWPTDMPDEPDAKFMAGVLADYRPNRQTFSFRPEAERALCALNSDRDI